MRTVQLLSQFFQRSRKYRVYFKKNIPLQGWGSGFTTLSVDAWDGHCGGSDPAFGLEREDFQKVFNRFPLTDVSLQGVPRP
jgi:hypothetical protein